MLYKSKSFLKCVYEAMVNNILCPMQQLQKNTFSQPLEEIIELELYIYIYIPEEWRWFLLHSNLFKINFNF